MITIVDYKDWHQPWFENLNRFWIEKYFEMEALDEWVLTCPLQSIIEPGGAILMGLYNGEVAGTVALRKVEAGVFEFTKMAVDKKFQRKGIAEALSYASFEKAKELGAISVILYTNSILTPAIMLYEKLGFTHVPIGKGEYKRSDVKMQIPIDKALHFAFNYKSSSK
ncbi:MAG TPA: GNAT family N-acetyltransferase [Ferruginibacter sp.]|nr:GNAT family N-acetyltransferase [Ferruginibacter sp.]